MLNALRQYKGIYSPEVLERMDPLRSKAFVRMTRTKVKTVDSRLSDLLFPANGEKNWGIDAYATAISSARRKRLLSLKLFLRIKVSRLALEELYVLMQDEAKNQAGKMSKVIEDQLAELKYREIMRDVMHLVICMVLVFLKGLLISISENRQYYKKEKNGVKRSGYSVIMTPSRPSSKMSAYGISTRTWKLLAPPNVDTSFSDGRWISTMSLVSERDQTSMET